jgi:anti-sigma regulatory factor (Ser/Thr protein kinase)
MKAEQVFPSERSSVPAVRIFVLDVLSSLPPTLWGRVMLAVSELATNAVIHGGGDLTVRVELDPSRLRIEMEDRGGGTPRLQPFQPPSSLHGRGLQIVDHVADRWGTTPSPTESGKIVWLEIELGAHEAQSAQSGVHRWVDRFRSIRPTNWLGRQANQAHSPPTSPLQDAVLSNHW